MRRVPGILIALVLCACSSTPPESREYLVAPAIEPAEGDPALPALRVERVRVRGFLDRAGIAWRGARSRAGSYRYERWAEPLEEQVRRALEAALVGSASVASEPTSTDADGPSAAGAAGLAVDVLGFHGDWSGEQPVAVVALRVERDRSLVREFRVVRSLADSTPEGLVLGLEQAFSELLQALRAWLTDPERG